MRCRLLYPIFLTSVLFLSPVASAEEDVYVPTDNTFTKSQLNFSFSAKDGSTNDSSAYGVTWSTELEHEPYELFENKDKYKFSVELSAESGQTKSSTEKTETDKYGIGLRFGAVETAYRFKPFISFGIENIKESKRNAEEDIRGDFNASFKWGAGFTFPIIDQPSSGKKYDPILGLEIAHFRNYDDFPFGDRVFDETKISLLFNVLAWWRTK